MLSTLLTVNISGRKESDYQRAKKTIQSYGFRWNKIAGRWQRYIEEIHAERFIDELRDYGIRVRRI